MRQKTPLQRREDRFLLLVLASRHDPDLVRSLTGALRKPLDWRRVLRQADRHGVVPLLWARLHEVPKESLPSGVAPHLRAACAFILRHNLALTAELVAILDGLAEAGIQAAPFKGPTLAMTAYGNIALRSFSDLDILIQLSDLHRAVSVLESRGYEPAVRFDAQYLASECQLRLISRQGHVAELHWQLLEKSFSCPLDIAGLWARMRKIELAGRTVPTPGNEDLFLYLCLHGAKHHWDRLEWICSIAEIVRGPALDWTEIHVRSRRLGCVRAVCLGLLLANRLLDAPIPREFQQPLTGDRVIPALAAHVYRSLDEQPARTSAAERIFHHYFLIRCRERPIDKWRVAIHSCARTPHPESKELVILPRALRFLYYVLRPLRLAGECAAFAWRWCLK